MTARRPIGFVFRWMAEAIRAHRDAAELASLSDRNLSDIGIDRMGGYGPVRDRMDRWI